jgi:putative toxin-antitoxin system antitoxin component (TIGR02293 family)
MTKAPGGSDVGATALEVLLGDRSLNSESIETFNAIQAGFPLEDVAQVLQSVGVLKNRNLTTWLIGMSVSTLYRRAKIGTLDSTHSDRLFRFATLIMQATDVFGDEASALDWMVQPALGLDGYCPVELLANSVGYNLVSTFLGRIEYGVYQ